MKNYFIVAIISFVLTIIAGMLVIPALKRIKAGQPILKYVKSHQSKNGTPTMGGLFFIIPSTMCCLIFGGINKRITLLCSIIGLSYMIVGFIDDFIKIKYKQNEGLKAYQKIIFQTAIAIISGVFCYINGISVMHLPFSNETVDLGAMVIPIVAVVFVAITNSVNLTDGLDGLASGVSVVYLLVLGVLIILQTQVLKSLYLRVEEYQSISMLCFCLVGGILGFLCFNTSKASVFMGDTGSLSLGGFIGAVSVFSSNVFFIPLLGIMFVVSSISVIVQVAYFKKNKKRVFLMAPFHHHLQLKGVSESKISYLYSIITLIIGAICLLSYV